MSLPSGTGKTVVSVLLALFTTACGSSGSSGGAATGGNSSGATGGGGTAAGGSGAVAASGGGSGGASGGVGGGTGGVGAGGAGGSGGVPACEPQAGTGTLQASCDQVRVAVIDRAGKHYVQVRARVTIWEPHNCVVLDEILLGQQSTVLQTLTTGGVTIGEDYNALLYEAEATSEIAELCKDENQRIEPFGLTAKGRADGGSFVATCGKAGSGGQWPPGVVLTCHSGIADAPYAGNAMIQPMGPYVSSQLFGAFRHPPGQDLVKTIDSDVRILPAVDSWSSPPIAPFDTTGWTGSAGESNANGIETSQVTMYNNQDVLGSELCPPIDPTDPTPGVKPVFLARVKGTTSSGAYQSELYVEMCTRVPAPPP